MIPSSLLVFLFFFAFFDRRGHLDHNPALLRGPMIGREEGALHGFLKIFSAQQ